MMFSNKKIAKCFNCSLPIWNLCFLFVLVTCPSLLAPNTPNGGVSYNTTDISGRYPVGTSALYIFDCPPPRIVLPSTDLEFFRTCLSSGQWSGQTLTCRGEISTHLYCLSDVDLNVWVLIGFNSQWREKNWYFLCFSQVVYKHRELVMLALLPTLCSLFFGDFVI